MAFTVPLGRQALRSLLAHPPTQSTLQHRTFLSWFKKSPTTKTAAPPPQSQSQPTLSEDDLFHPFSKSPFPAVRARGAAIQELATCPTCSANHKAHGTAAKKSNLVKDLKAQELPKKVEYECPDCGFPTHCSEEHWKEDKAEHAKYCSRLREVNEDEHDLRSGRHLREFDLPGRQGFEEAISFANWDVFWYTRGFPSMDTERSRRHSSKLLTYPLTIGSVLHQHSPLMITNQRLTPEGSRSMAALRSTLHVPSGAPENAEGAIGKAQVRIFILGARAESSLPPHVWEQLGFLFPAAHFHLFFIGPQVSLPKPPAAPKPPAPAANPPNAKDGPPPQEATEEEDKKPIYLPNVYEPPTPAPIDRLKYTRSSLARYGFPAYTVPYTYQLTITGIRANYADVHAQFQPTLDPYSDLFFFFSPGFGFPSPNPLSTDPSSDDKNKRLLQIASPTEWGPVMPMLLASKCPIFVTGFSPADVERDVTSLGTAPDVAGEFEWVITPGQNVFGSEKWEVADFDPRVMVKTNWGVWGIRGKSRDVRDNRRFNFGL